MVLRNSGRVGSRRFEESPCIEKKIQGDFCVYKNKKEKEDSLNPKKGQIKGGRKKAGKRGDFCDSCNLLVKRMNGSCL